MANLPAPPANSPFAKAPLRWGVEPSEGFSSSRYVSQITYQVRTTGVTSVYPLFSRQATLPFNAAGMVISCVLASSIVNSSAGTPAAIMVHKDVGPIINANGAANELVSHVVEQALSHSQRGGISFIDDYGARYNSGESIGIYISSADAGCALTGIVSIRYLVIT